MTYTPPPSYHSCVISYEEENARLNAIILNLEKIIDQLRLQLSRAIIPDNGDIELLRELRLYLGAGGEDIIDRELKDWEKRRQKMDQMILRYMRHV